VMVAVDHETLKLTMTLLTTSFDSVTLLTLKFPQRVFDMILEFTSKAKENLAAAQLLFDHGLYNASANRAYYAAFQAALVALARAKVLDQSRVSHETAQGKFAAELIHRRKIYPSHLKSYLMELQGVRDDADYKLSSISKKEAAKQLRKAQEFVNLVTPE